MLIFLLTFVTHSRTHSLNDLKDLNNIFLDFISLQKTEKQLQSDLQNYFDDANKDSDAKYILNVSGISQRKNDYGALLDDNYSLNYYAYYPGRKLSNLSYTFIEEKCIKGITFKIPEEPSKSKLCKWINEFPSKLHIHDNAFDFVNGHWENEKCIQTQSFSIESQISFSKKEAFCFSEIELKFGDD